MAIGVVNPYMAVHVPFYAACFIASLVAVKGGVGIQPVSTLCNRNLVNPTDNNYINSVNEVLTVLSRTAPEELHDVAGRYFAYGFSQGAIPPKGYLCFGHASCKDSLAEGDCTQCVTMAVGYLREACPSSIGGQIQLPQCRVRYEPYNFTE